MAGLNMWVPGTIKCSLCICHLSIIFDRIRWLTECDNDNYEWTNTKKVSLYLIWQQNMYTSYMWITLSYLTYTMLENCNWIRAYNYYSNNSKRIIWIIMLNCLEAGHLWASFFSPYLAFSSTFSDAVCLCVYMYSKPKATYCTGWRAFSLET